MNIKKLLFIQGIITLATFLLIVIKPTAIPNSFGLVVTPENYVLPYLIGANEAALSFLSFAAMKIKSSGIVTTISIFFLLFHLVTGLMCIDGMAHGTPIKIAANAAFRGVMASLFYYYGIYEINRKIYRHE